jgi:predicted amidohydrolase YtcJ
VHDRIEHIETVSAEGIPRFGSLGVIASFQPLHAYPNDNVLNVWLKAAGPERGTRAWAWRSIAAQGGVLAFGSDWPVVTMDPWQGMQSAVTRQTVEQKPEGGFVPSERITLERAIAGYTIGAAMGGRRERIEGSLTVGKMADLIVLSQDLFAIDPHTISQTKVLLTMVGGRIVYHAPEWGELR